MDFLLGPDLAEFRETLRKYLSSAPVADLRARSRAPADGPGAELPLDEAIWKQLAELGAMGAAIPEEAGGLGLGPMAAQLVVEELTRALMPLPAIVTAGYSATVLAALEGEAARTVLTEIAAGALRVTCSLPNLFGEAAPVRADAATDGRRTLTGTLRFVQGAHLSERILVLASGAAPGFYAVDPAGSGITGKPLETFDLLDRYQHLTLDGVEASPVTGPLDAVSVEQLRARVLVLQAAELFGAMARALDLTVEHVKTRTQFGAPIGSFQAVQHLLADMKLRVDQAGTLGRFAAWCAASDPSQLIHAAYAAKGFAAEHAPKVIEKAIQVHGGMGFTFEFELHLYLRRALMVAGLGPRAHECYGILGRPERA